MPFACEEFQVFHFGVIVKFLKKNHVQAFFLLFIALFKVSILRSYGVKQMNMNNIRRQAYGVWKPPSHMPLTIAGV
jgi:hypothetical protein